MSARTYRLPPRDRMGWFLGLEGPRVLVLGAGLLAASVLALNASHPGVALAPAIIGVSLAFARLGGEPLVVAIPPLVAFAARRVTGRRSWLAPVPGRVVPEGPTLPAAMAAQSLVSCVVDGRRDQGPLGVVHDRRTGAWAATLRVAGNGFCLLDAADQERLLSLWGQALSGFCVNGHGDLPTGGHGFSPRTATGSPRGRPPGVPADGHGFSPRTAMFFPGQSVRGTTPLPARASARRRDSPSVRRT